MHYLVNPSPRVHASTEELIGLIRTAGEILDFQIPPDANPALILDVNSESLCRVAAYRLTNCVGAYNSGRTDSGHEPRWAYKDGAGSWIYHSKAHFNGTRSVGVSRDEVWVRQWIASAPYVGSTPVANPTETEACPRPAAHTVRECARPEAEPEGRYFGPTRSPMAYHNHTAEHGQALFNLIHPMLGDHTHTPDPGVVALYRCTSFGREGRVAIRQGRRWYRFRIFSNGRVSRVNFMGRARAVQWVNAAPSSG